MKDDQTLQKGKNRSPLADAPAFPIFLGWSVAVFLTETGAYPLWAIACISLLAPVSWIFLGTESPNRSSLSVFVLSMLILAGGSVFLHARMTAHEEIPQRVEAQGRVLTARLWGFRRVALVKTKLGRYVLSMPRDESVRAGDIVFFSGGASPFPRASEENKFDEYLYWRAKGARCAVESDVLTVRGRSRSPAAWREDLSGRIEKALPPRTAGYLLASWTGMRESSLESLHRAAGTSHLLAVSGFHVGVVATICNFLLAGFRCRSAITGPLVWLYAAITGGAPSAIRAALMVQAILLGRMFGRSGRAFNSTALAGSLMLLHNPWIFWDVGWRLSMLAVLTLAALQMTGHPKAVKGLMASILTWLATAPQAASTFGAVPLAGIITNCFALPVFAVLLPAASLLSLPALLGIPKIRAVSNIAELLFALWETFSSNIVYLCPWKMPFSSLFALLASLVLAFLFANASGFSRTRACILLLPVAFVTFYLLTMM